MTSRWGNTCNIHQLENRKSNHSHKLEKIGFEQFGLFPVTAKAKLTNRSWSGCWSCWTCTYGHNNKTCMCARLNYLLTVRALSSCGDCLYPSFDLLSNPSIHPRVLGVSTIFSKTCHTHYCISVKKHFLWSVEADKVFPCFLAKYISTYLAFSIRKRGPPESFWQESFPVFSVSLAHMWMLNSDRLKSIHLL